MGNRAFANWLAVMGAGLFATSLSSFLEHFAILGTATDFARGLFDGLSVVAFAAAVFLLFRSTWMGVASSTTQMRCVHNRLREVRW